MNRSRCLIVPTLACLLSGPVTRADPIHAIADGAFWHHDSGWVFPEKIGEFARVGAAQDVAGSNDAVAHYARVAAGLRIVAAVDVYPADSAAAQGEVESGKLLSEDALALNHAHASSALRRIYSIDETGIIALYSVTAGEWRVRIRFSGAQADMVPAMDAFVLAQRWETLTGE